MRKNERLKKTLFLLLSFCFVLSVSAQQKPITGNVTGMADGMPLPGVNVIIKGTTNGTSTDFDGNYSIEASASDVLVFSYIGYVSQEITVGSSSVVNAILAEDVDALDEVVVVGYGARKKSDLTGAVSSVKADELTAFPVLSAEQALQGRAAGVAVQSNNGGEPGAPIAIRIRGNTSIGASSSALIVVDGFVGASMPQANDIQSMEVLKDASATAIYGSRGANGVVLVTTKKGRKGKLSVEFNTDYSVQNTSDRLDLLNANQFGDYQTAINPSYTRGSENTDWQDLLYTSGHTANYQLAFSGGTDKINFYASGTYYDQDGVIINSGFKRASFLSNIDAQITDKLKLGLNTFGSRGEKTGVPTQSTGDTANGGGDDVISLGFRFAPDLGIKDADGNNTINSVGDDVDNPYAVATERVDDTKTDTYRANAYLNYDIIEGLDFKTTFGFSTVNQTRGVFQPSTLTVQSGPAGGRAVVNNFKRTNVLSENYLTYKRDIGKGAFTLLGGYSYQKTGTDRFSAGAEQFTSDSFSYYNLAGGAVQLIPTSSLSETEIQSFFGRVNYDWDDRFLITATVRRDGASNFAANNKYATFPSGALGWKISNEEFLKDSETVSNLKLRASYGVTGNPAVEPYQSLARLEDIYAVTNGQTVNAVVPNQQANPDLKWESSYQTNIGIDLGFLDNAISLSLDYYNIDTKDLILRDTGQPQYFGFSNPTSFKNIGEINNTGFEISLNTRNISNENFNWTTDFNLSTNKNKVVSLIDGADVFFDASPPYWNIPRTHVLREGETVGAFYGYEYRGVYQGGNFPAGTATLANNNEPGDQLFTDVDGDGVINPTDDEKIIGDPNQDWIMGFTNSFRYKDFDLNIFFQGAFGGDLMNLTQLQLANGDSNASTDVLNAWTPTNTNTDVPSAKIRGKEISSRFVSNGSYVRLKNLALGYNLPSDLTDKLGIDKLRLAISGQNLLTFTDYDGLDPEVSYGVVGGNNQDSNVNQGFDFGNYPNIKSVTFSLNLKF